MPVEDRERLVETLKERLDVRPEILEGYLFGSSAHGRAQPHSDVDLAVYVAPDYLQSSPFGYAAELAADLSAALCRDAVDVLVLNQAPPLLYHRVLRDGVRLIARELAATTTREGRALSRYCDYVPHLRKVDTAHAARLERGDFARLSPGELDPAVIRRHLFALDQALQVLRRHQGRPINILRTDREERWVVERGLQLCVQNVFDIATHIAASAGRDVPDYANAIDQLAELDVLPGDFARDFRAVAGFRNVVIHDDLDVDPVIVHRLLNERLEDFSEFARMVNQYLDRRAKR